MWMKCWIARCRLGCALWLLLVFLWPVPAAAAGSTVEDINVTVDAANHLPPLIQGRMQTSVQAIAAQLIDGHALTEVIANQEQYENIIHEVFDKILVGYSVQRVSIVPGTMTVVQIDLLPWNDVIQQVDVKLSVDGMPPEVEAMVRKDLAGVDEVFSQALIGLPLAAEDWTNGVLKHSLNAFMEEHLPEFRADFDIDPQTQTIVHLVVYPRMPAVRTIDLNMRSDTVQNVLLLNHRRLMQDKANLMLGVPVGFVKRHQSEFCALMQQSLDATGDFRTYDMHTVVTLQPDENTVVMSYSDTDKYRLRLEGWADIGGPKDDNLRFRLHAGQKPSHLDEFFTLLDFYPQHVKWGWQIGYMREVAPRTSLNLRYDLRKSHFILGGEYSLSRRWLLRYEYRWADQKGEAALRYRMHDFLSLEYVIDKDDSWIRLIGNF